MALFSFFVVWQKHIMEQAVLQQFTRASRHFYPPKSDQFQIDLGPLLEGKRREKLECWMDTSQPTSPREDR
jgi:hypothetical protein